MNSSRPAPAWRWGGKAGNSSSLSKHGLSQDDWCRVFAWTRAAARLTGLLLVPFRPRSALMDAGRYVAEHTRHSEGLD